MKALLIIEIPNYLTHVMLDRSRPANYYTRRTKIPVRYMNSTYGFNNYGVLVNAYTGKPVVANPLTAGKPKYKKINGRELLAGRISPVVRSRIIHEMKRFYLPYFMKKKKIREACKIRVEIHNAIGEGNQDLDNMSWILVKVLQDVLVEANILPQENVKVIKGFEVDFVPTLTKDERKLVVVIYAHEPKTVWAESI